MLAKSLNDMTNPKVGDVGMPPSCIVRIVFKSLFGTIKRKNVSVS